MMFRSCVTLAALLAASCAGGPDATQTTEDELTQYWMLAPEEAASLEERLAENPDDVSARARLIQHYDSAQWEDEDTQERYAHHVLWLIENDPEADILAQPDCHLDASLHADAFATATITWSRHLESMPENLSVLRNASKFFMFSAPRRAIELLERGRSLDNSNPEWSRELGQMHSMDMSDGVGEPDVAAAARALAEFETAYELSEADGKDALLEDLAKTALVAGETEKAQAYAEAMLGNTAEGWNLGNRVHHGHLVLGRIALAEGNVEQAKNHLLEAGATPGSPQLDSFGPNMLLAKELLERGETDTVVRYFELCSEFWELDSGRLSEWTALARADIVPDFEANLVY